jgi:hypothetical protein
MAGKPDGMEIGERVTRKIDPPQSDNLCWRKAVENEKGRQQTLERNEEMGTLGQKE